MTIILALGNRENVIQLSDRRLTSKGKIVDEEAGKAGVVSFNNGRFTYGFTGIARIGDLDINRWILDTLLEEGPPDYVGGKVLERFGIRASDFFKNNKYLKKLKSEKRRLTVLISGYLDKTIPPKIGCAIVSNFIDLKKNIFTSKSWEKFEVSVTQEKDEKNQIANYIQRVGATSAMKEEDEIYLRLMLQNKKPEKAIINKAIKVMLKMADHDSSRGTIGKQISWIRIPSDKSKAIESGYYSNIPTHEIFIPSFVSITSADDGTAMDFAKLEAVDKKSTPFISVPKVHRNSPCKCGSGKRYKNCHGKIKNQL